MTTPWGISSGTGAAGSTRPARGLRLCEAEREHLFILAQNRPPEIVPREPEPVDPGLLTFELTTLSVDSHPGLKLIIFTPQAAKTGFG